MALLRIGQTDFLARRKAVLSKYDDEEPYMPGGAYDDADDRYADAGYDTGYDDDFGYDDGYGDGYADEYYDDDGYGDAYADEYYDDGYDNGYDGEYADEYYDDAPYDEPAYPAGALGEALRYCDDHDWVTWLALVLLPPLGIWLLWRRGRYARNTTWVLTALSALWLVLAIVLLVVKPFRPRSDTTITPQPVGAATQGLTDPNAAEEAPEPAESVLLAEEEVDEAVAVYLVADTPYYHKLKNCPHIPEGAETPRVGENTAIERSLMACPYCMGSQYSDGLWDLVFVNADTEDRSNIRVYCSRYNTHFHTDPACSDLGSDAHEVPLKEALLMAKTTCEVCCPLSAMQFYCTLDGTYYHAKSDCSGMANASYVTYAEARVIGKKRCPKCIGGTDPSEESADGANGIESTTYMVWATPKGAYYHIEEHCSGMNNAQRVPLSQMLASNRPACPVCCPNAEMIVYAQQGNPYYHSNNSCSGMTQPVQGILINALAAGLQRCPVCWTATN